MNFYCPNCKAYYTQPDEQIPSTGLTVKCLDCGTLISLPSPAARQEAPAAAAAQAPTGAPGEAMAGVGPSGAGGEVPINPDAGLRSAQPALYGVAPLGEGPDSLDAALAPFEQENELTVPVVGPASAAAPILLPLQSGKAHGPGKSSGVLPELRQSAAPSVQALSVQAPSVSAPASPLLALAASGRPMAQTWRPADLWVAARAACHRRTVEAAIVLFGAACLVLLISWLGGRSSLPALRAFSMVLALVLLGFSLLALAAALTATLHRELGTGQRGGLRDGLPWTTAHLGTVLLTPLVTVGMGLALLLVVALLQLPARVPSAGRVLYGLAFGPSLLLSLAIVLLALLSVPLLFYFLPLLQHEDRGPWRTVRGLVSLLARRGGPALGLLLLSLVSAAVLLVALLAVSLAGGAITAAMGMGLLGGPAFHELLRHLPPSLCGVVLQPLGLLGAAPLPDAASAGWGGLDAGALLLGLGALGCIVLLASFLLTYLCGAGLISFYVLSGRVRGEKR